MQDFSLKDFHYELPSELIAQSPLAVRDASRLLVVDNNNSKTHYSHEQFHSLARYLKPLDLLIFNQTKVMKARLYGGKPTGGKVELLVEKIEGATAFCHIKTSKAPRAGSLIHFNEGVIVEVIAKLDSGLYSVQLQKSQLSWYEILETQGHMPLPPYITRAANANDDDRYQTLWAQDLGAVAAPTASLHFSDTLLQELQSQDIQFGYLTLHVGAGTFQPVREQELNKHIMHEESYFISQNLVDQITATKQRGGRIIAVGTTVLRALESSALKTGQVTPIQEETRLFIRPGFQFKVVDHLITNFHLPESTLLMLVAAFIGYNEMMAAYQEAIMHNYRFFSYGDALFLSRSLVTQSS